MDPFDDFQFKPLTEGLGFNKKTEKGKTAPQQSTMVATERLEIEMPSHSISLNAETENDLLGRDSAKSSKSISDLIASLPPSLDFLSDNEDARTPAAPPQPRYSLTKTPERPRQIMSEQRIDLRTQQRSDAIQEMKTAKRQEMPRKESETPRPQIFQPLAREDYLAPAPSSGGGVSGGGPTIGQVLPAPGTKVRGGQGGGNSATFPIPTSSRKNRMDENLSRAFPRPGRKIVVNEQGEVMPVAAHLGAGILDGMVVTGMSMLLLVCILLITKVNLLGLLNNAQTDVPTQVHLALLFFAVLQLYMLTARSFFGSSLGEWACDIQLGSSFDQSRIVYPILVAWRTLVVSITGVVVLPILSMIAKRDLIKFATGLQLYRKL